MVKAQIKQLLTDVRITLNDSNIFFRKRFGDDCFYNADIASIYSDGFTTAQFPAAIAPISGLTAS